VSLGYAYLSARVPGCEAREALVAPFFGRRAQDEGPQARRRGCLEWPPPEEFLERAGSAIVSIVVATHTARDWAWQAMDTVLDQDSPDRSCRDG